MEDSDDRIFDEARERARRLLDTVSRDVDSLRSAGSDAAYQDGAALCDELVSAVRDLMSQLEPERPHS